MTVWYTAPTAIRMMMKLGGGHEALRPVAASLPRQRRRAAESRSGGLGRRGVRPAVPRQLVADRDRRHHDRELRRHGRQARLDGPAPARDRGRDRAPGEAGVEPIAEPGVEGELALRAGWPSMMRGYLMRRSAIASASPTAGTSPATSRSDTDGYYWFVGRADDVIKSSGHLIGPFEVESALMEHAAVEAGVIGKPDPMAGEIVKAFVALKPATAVRRSAQGAAGSGPQAAGCRGGAQGDRFPAGPAAHPQRQDHAPPAQGARAGPARGRSRRSRATR